MNYLLGTILLANIQKSSWVVIVSINNHAPQVTIEDLVMGKEELWARSQTTEAGVMKFYINPGGGLINNGTGVTNPNGGNNVALGLNMVHVGYGGIYT